MENDVIQELNDKISMIVDKLCNTETKLEEITSENKLLRNRLVRLEEYFKHHRHEYHGMSKPRFSSYCPECGTIDNIKQKGSLWVCTDCNHVFIREDFNSYFMDKPYEMPRDVMKTIGEGTWGN